MQIRHPSAGAGTSPRYPSPVEFDSKLAQQAARAASLVLRDNLAAIVRARRLGRGIFDSLRKHSPHEWVADPTLIFQSLWYPTTVGITAHAEPELWVVGWPSRRCYVRSTYHGP